MNKAEFSSEHQRLSLALLGATAAAKKLDEQEQAGNFLAEGEFQRVHEQIRIAAEGLENLWKLLRAPSFKLDK